MVKLIDESSKEAFIDYCRKFIQSMTILFLPSETFVADEDHPSVILLDRNDEVIGAASLILEGRYRSLRRGRFMILHSKSSMTDAYRSLLTPLLSKISGIDEVYLFVSLGKPVESILKEIDFKVERYSFVLKRRLISSSLETPEEIDFTTFDLEKRGETFCKIINSAFAKLAGHFDIDPDWLRSNLSISTVPDSGIQLLYKENEPVGLFFSEINSERLLEIGPLALLPGF